MSQRGGRTLVLVIGSAILGSIATMIFYDSAQQQSQQTQLNRKTDPRVPPKPIWKNSPEGLAEDKSAAQAEIKKQPSANSPFPAKKNAQRVPVNLDNPPKASQLRGEAESDPHGTPFALLEFAEELAQSMTGAFANPDDRYQVSRQLIACARDSDSKGSAQAARALCLANLERLKNKFPDELSASYLSLIAELPDDLVFVAGVRTTTDTEKQ
jgi:hypothetical protein